MGLDLAAVAGQADGDGISADGRLLLPSRLSALLRWAGNTRLSPDRAASRRMLPPSAAPLESYGRRFDGTGCFKSLQDSHTSPTTTASARAVVSGLCLPARADGHDEPAEQSG